MVFGNGMAMIVVLTELGNPWQIVMSGNGGETGSQIIHKLEEAVLLLAGMGVR